MSKSTKILLAGFLAFILTSILISNPVYTSIKGAVYNLGGSVGLSIIIAWTLILLSLILGIFLIKKSFKGT